jgi:hypothetical protein
MTVPPPEHVVLLVIAPVEGSIVMDPVQTPVKLHVPFEAKEGQLKLSGPDAVLQVPVLVPLANACWMALMHAFTFVTCAAAGVPPNPSNVRVRPKIATAVRA